HQLADGSVHACFQLAVHRAGGFVENQHEGVDRERPSERDQLALPYRDGHTALAERLIEPEREPANEVVRTHPGQRLRQSFFADVRPTERDVPADVVVEQEHVLEYEYDPRT